MNRLKTFVHAFNGLKLAFSEEPNFRFHILATALVLILGVYFDIERVDWMIVIICIGLVVSAELFNTAIENVCDLITEEHHPRVKKIKDISAAGVLVISLIALIVGLWIYCPYVATLFA